MRTHWRLAMTSWEVAPSWSSKSLLTNRSISLATLSSDAPHHRGDRRRGTGDRLGGRGWAVLAQAARGSRDPCAASDDRPGLDRHWVGPLGRSPAGPASTRSAGNGLDSDPAAGRRGWFPPGVGVRGSTVDRRPQSGYTMGLGAGGQRGPFHTDGLRVNRPGCPGALHAVLQRAAARTHSLLLSPATVPDLGW